MTATELIVERIERFKVLPLKARNIKWEARLNILPNALEKNMLTDQESTQLGNAISSLVSERGLGSLTKKDYELLVFHHLAASKSLQLDGNYVLANKLKVTETRIKSLLLESSIRHQPANHRAVLGKIVQRIVDRMTRPDFSGGQVSITLENPVDRREFEYAVKLARHSVEYGINREVLKIDAIALFEVVMANIENAEARFKEIVQSCIQTKVKQQEILDKSLTFRQKVNKLGAEVTANGGAVQMLTAAVGLF